MLVVTVTFTVQPEQSADFLTAVRQQARNSLEREPGCRQFDVCVDEHQPGQVFLYEVYDDAATFDEHVRTPHFHDFDAKTAGWVVQQTVHTWTRAGE